MSNWGDFLQNSKVLLTDGGMGTMLFDSGLEFGDPPEAWNLEYPERVRDIHRRYLEAGAGLLLTNTFGGNRFRLGMHNLENQVADFNRAGAEALRAEVDLHGRDALVAGDMGPSGEILAPLGDLKFAKAVSGFAEQAAALIEGGVDVIWIETMSDLEEVRAAMEGVRRASPEIPIITTMTFDTRGHTMMGVSPENAVTTLVEAGAAGVGANCGNGPDEILEVLSKMSIVSSNAILVAKSNAGVPELVKGRAVYGASPHDMAEYSIAVRDVGVRVIGGCCGSTPEHIEAMASALASD